MAKKGYMIPQQSEEHVYLDIYDAWNNQSEGSDIVKVEVSELLAIEIVHEWTCPGCEQVTTGLREEDKIFCIYCSTWQENRGSHAWSDLEAVTTRLIELAIQKLTDEGKDKEEINKIFKHFVAVSNEMEKEKEDAV
jgi:hypothetical protein